jgi:hypothetical protein
VFKKWEENPYLRKTLGEKSEEIRERSRSEEGRRTRRKKEKYKKRRSLEMFS